MKINDVKKFWDKRPCNIRHSTETVGTQEYFNQVEARRNKVEPHIPGFAEFESWEGKKILEVGCGIGTDAVCFARGGAKYTAIELSQKSLDLARQRFDIFGLPGNFYLGNAEELSSIVPIEPYDLIYSFGVIHHSPNPERIISKVKQYMNNKSEFRLMLYAKNSWKNIMIDCGLDQPEAQFGCPVAYTYTQDEVRGLLKDFDILELRQDHIFPYVIEKYIKYEYELQPWFKEMPPDMFRALKNSLGWHTLIRCRLKKDN